MLKRKLMANSSVHNKIAKNCDNQSLYFSHIPLDDIHTSEDNLHYTTNERGDIAKSYDVQEKHYNVTGSIISNEKQNIEPLPGTATISESLLKLQTDLCYKLKELNFKVPPIEYVYNPLEYAYNPHEKYVKTYCCSTKKIIFAGMNPGPFGMCQTGVPFGDPKLVKEFLKIEGIVGKPDIECPSRKISGFLSQRTEQSGHRFWGFFQNICQTADVFFRNAFIYNFCPLALMKANGCNVTPADIKNMKIRRKLEEICEIWYLQVIHLLQPEYIIAVGTYMEKKTKNLLKAYNISNIKLLCMPHPSPRAVNNQNWSEKAQDFLDSNNLTQYFLP